MISDNGGHVSRSSTAMILEHRRTSPCYTALNCPRPRFLRNFDSLRTTPANFLELKRSLAERTKVFCGRHVPRCSRTTERRFEGARLNEICLRRGTSGERAYNLTTFLRAMARSHTTIRPFEIGPVNSGLPWRVHIRPSPPPLSEGRPVELS